VSHYGIYAFFLYLRFFLASGWAVMSYYNNRQQPWKSGRRAYEEGEREVGQVRAGKVPLVHTCTWSTSPPLGPSYIRTGDDCLGGQPRDNNGERRMERPPPRACAGFVIPSGVG
jgi:hypothetical protein